jgi:hypothetical protein
VCGREGSSGLTQGLTWAIIKRGGVIKGFFGGLWVEYGLLVLDWTKGEYWVGFIL